MAAHAVLAPSSASKWLNCPPSARLEEGFENEDSPFAREGTLAHALAEACLRQWVLSGQAILEMHQWRAFKEKEFYTESMLRDAQGFANYVLKNYVKNSLLFIEQNLIFARWIPEGFGTSDAAVLNIKKKTLYVSDLKYGKGVEVSEFDNPQLKIYALGVLDYLEPYDYNIETVVLAIYQPRLQNISEFTITVDDLYLWAEKELKPKAVLAFAGEGEQKAGSHCKFCRAAGDCRKLAEFNQDLAKHEFKDASTLDDFELMDVYGKMDIFKSWMDAVQKFALSEALKGKQFPGYKLIEASTKRTYGDNQDKIVRELHKKFDFGVMSEIFKPKQLVTFEELKVKIGVEAFVEIVDPLLISPRGGPALVPVSKRGKPYNSAESDFNEPVSAEYDFMN